MYVLQHLLGLSPYQWQRLMDLAETDRSQRGNSLAKPFTRSLEDKNVGMGQGNRGYNIYQGKNAGSNNLFRLLNDMDNHHNVVQHGAENALFGGAGKSLFNWQGGGDQSSNIAESMAEKFISWQRGKFNIADASKAGNADLWQGGYASGTKNIARGAKGDNKVTQVTGNDGVNGFTTEHNGNVTLNQSGQPGTINTAQTGKGDDNITQSSFRGDNRVESGCGNDKVTFNGDHNKLDAFTACGNDEVTVNGHYNNGKIDLGGGDDKLTINGTNNELKMDGGTGNNSVFVNGSQNDYNLTRGDNGIWSMASKADPSKVSTFNNINDFYFRGSDGNYARFAQPTGVSGTPAQTTAHPSTAEPTPYTSGVPFSSSPTSTSPATTSSASPSGEGCTRSEWLNQS